MAEKIVVSGREFTCPETARGAVRTVYGGGRHWVDITVYGTVDEVKAAFDTAFRKEYTALSVIMPLKH